MLWSWSRCNTTLGYYLNTEVCLTLRERVTVITDLTLTLRYYVAVNYQLGVTLCYSVTVGAKTVLTLECYTVDLAKIEHVLLALLLEAGSRSNTMLSC